MSVQHSFYIQRSIALVLLIAVFLSPGILCAGEEPDTIKPNALPDSTRPASYLTEPIDQEKVTDEDWLLMHNSVKRGITYEETKKLFPNIGDLTTEGAGAVLSPGQGLYEAHLSITIFDHPARIEFNYRRDDKSETSLYTYYWQIMHVDSVTAERLYSRIKEFYSSLYGSCEEERETFEFFQEYCSWDVDVVTPSLVKNIYSADHAYIGWGD
ncbi:MAG: hypothetical protein KKG33_06035 [candidate division Zixibacteria bacterium]|nr:hypothetical protein [candidate division Zixibacteria bacterium]MBU1469586.1 hypothetical protein [candidate division Zixibacteria bacterium]MBU2625101.1 hypothetical protein [candidate division Zixibacteria bacterium]